MASDPAGLIALVGAGIDELSIRTSAVETIGALIPLIDRQKTIEIMQKLVKDNRNTDIRHEILKEFPNMAEFFF
jgi:signal transduction protein with GAF and PtsI domain